MCGIVGYIGSKEAYPVLIKGLHRLEYRGYDSSGVAMISDEGKLNIYKAKGKVAALEHFAESKDRSGTVGIAHTRWATHGEPNDTNAHPHASQSGDLAIVHNGTIENYTVVKKALEQHGYAFRSETDTEVVVQLIDYIRTDTGCTLFEAVREACHQIVGAYAIAVIDRRNPNQIVVARKSSPLVIGVGDGEYFIASDATPIVEYTNRVVYLNDDEIAVINRGESLHVFNMDNKESKVNIQKLRMSISELEKGGYPHFMLKEIFEQPRTLRDCIRGRVSADGKHVVLSGVLDNKERFLDAHRILIVACGTSWHAALIGKHLFEDMCRIPVERIPLPQSGSERQGRADCHVAVGRDGRHARRTGTSQGAGRLRLRYLQRHRFVDSARHRFGVLHPRRTRNRRRLDQGLHRTGDRAGDDGADARPHEGHDRR